MVNESETNVRVCKPDTNSPIHCELLADESGDNTLSTDSDSASVRDVLVVKNNSKLIQAAGTIMVPIKINGKSINAVLDTAAEVSVLSNTFVTQNWPHIQFSGDVSLQGIGNNSVQSHLWENVNITLGNMDYPWHVFVAPIHDTCILGLDFIMRYEIDIRMSGHGLFIEGEKSPFEIQGKNKSIPLNIRTAKLHQNVIIPAYTCVSLPLQIKSHHFDKNDLVLFEPIEHKELSFFSVVFTGNDCLPVNILNYSDHNIELKCDTVIGVKCFFNIGKTGGTNKWFNTTKFWSLGRHLYGVGRVY